MEGQEGEGRDTRERQTGWRRRPSVPIRVHISELTYGNVLANRGGRTKKRGRSSVGWWGMGDGRLSANCPANMPASPVSPQPTSPNAKVLRVPLICPVAPKNNAADIQKEIFVLY